MQINNYMDKEGKIKCWPAKTESKLGVLRFLGNKFDTGRFYHENEINRITDENHSFGDYFLLRREMVNHGVLLRTADGARYWRGGLWPEAGRAETERLTIVHAAKDDDAGIAEIYNACAYIGEWTGEKHDEAGLRALLGNTDLPPCGSREFSHLVVIREKNGKAAGFAQYYTAWPEHNCIWIGLMLLHPRVQKQGYGREFIEAFLAESRMQGYGRAGLGVALLNQPALKFWVKSGFDRITKVTADGEAGEGSLGLLGLARSL